MPADLKRKMMQKLVQGIHTFQTHVFRKKQDLFRSLANGQKPATLFVTCSDSRVNPNLFTQTEPGEIFVLRNAGNLIPPAPFEGGEIATIEFAVVALGIQDIIICGHSDCGAMKGLSDPGMVKETMPTVHRWLRHADRTAQIMQKEYQHLQGGELLTATVEENVIVQIENLRTHDFIEERLAQGELKLHGWVYKFETGEVFNYEPETGQFLPLGIGREPTPTYPRIELSGVTHHDRRAMRMGR
jgi:carbonic anhydrase